MNFEALVKHISTIQNTLQAQAAHAVNLALTSRNWLMGCYIVEFEQNGEDRAAYGEQLLKKLEQRLKTKGLNERRFREFRRLYLVYPQLKEQILHYIMSGNEIRHTLSAEFTDAIRRLLTAKSDNEIRRSPTAEFTQHIQSAYNKWITPPEKLFSRLSSTHLNVISPIDNPVKRAFYEMEAIRGCWSVKELERQINSMLYERLLLSNDKEAVLAVARKERIPESPMEIIKDPMVLEVLGLERQPAYYEKDLEKAIITHIADFLLELLCKPLHKSSYANKFIMQSDLN